MSESDIQLDYAKPPRWHRRRWFARAMIAVALIAVAASAWRWGPEKWEKAQLLYWQWRCMTYSPPADQIVFDQDPAGKSPLLNGGQEYIPVVESGFDGPAITVAARVPDCTNRFISLLYGPGKNWSQPILFMHERTTRSGHRYLIILFGESFEKMDYLDGQLGPQYVSYKPGTLRNRPEPAGNSMNFKDDYLQWPSPRHLRIYAGQADPIDASHFTIRYVEDGKTRMVDGYLEDAETGDPASDSSPGMARVKLIERKMP